MKRFYCVILAMLAVVLYAIVMSGCRAISSNVEVATQPVVETPLAEHIGKVRQGPFVNDAEEFVRNISVLLEEKSPHDYSVRRIEEILLNNGYLEEYFKGNTEPLALYCFEYIINHESLCYVSDNQNVSFSGNDKAIALIAWELMLTYDDTDLNYITSASSLENWLYFLRTGAPVNFILAESNIDDTYYTTHPIEKQYIVAMLRDPKRIFFLTVNYLSDPELIQETNLAFYRLFSSGIMNMQMTIIPENTTIEDLRANCTEFSYWVINEKNDDIILEITSDTGNLIQVMPVYDKPASATANTRTMQDETATKSSSEKSSEATTESAQSEDASALIFPNPCSEQFDLSERDAVLFDAAVAARNRTPNADICIPEIGVYGTYEEAEKTVIVCHVCYHFYYGCDGTEHYTDSGAMQAPAKAVLEVSDDMLHCVSFELVPNGAGTNVWAKEFCGPLTDLASYFLSPEQDEEWPLENTMPSSEQLFREYIETYKKYT